MNWLDMIKELRSGKPNSKTTARVMALSSVGVIIGINAIIWEMNFMGDQDLFSPAMLKYLLMAQVVIGGLGLLSALGIHRKARWGIVLGQILIILFLLDGTVLAWLFISRVQDQKGFPQTGPAFLLPMLVVVFVLGSNAVLAYYALGYLGRLPADGGPETPTLTNGQPPRL